jgi:hypothetical protein
MRTLAGLASPGYDIKLQPHRFLVLMTVAIDVPFNNQQPTKLIQSKRRHIPVCVLFVIEWGLQDVALVCINGLHSNALLRNSFGAGGATITCGRAAWS